MNNNWYAKTAKWINNNFDDPALFAALLAATSPRKQVRANLRLAARLYRQFRSGQELDLTGLMPCHKGNIDRAIAGEPLSGPKVRAFYFNLIGDYDHVTIDIWVLRSVGEKRTRLSPKQYKRLEKKIKRRARYHKMSPAEYQALLWERERAKAGKAPVSFVSVAEENQLLLEFK